MRELDRAPAKRLVYRVAGECFERRADIGHAAVFIEREGEGDPVVLLTKTDAQGVFTIAEPPPGSYRIAVYKDASSIEIVGMDLGDPGTTVLPVRLALE